MTKKYINNEYLKSANINDPFYDIEVHDAVLKFIKQIVESGCSSNNKIDKMLAFDVGAYVGSSIPRIKAMGFDRVFCFEADPETFSILVDNYKNIQGISLLNQGISSKSGAVSFYKCDRNRPFLNTMHKNWIFETKHKELVSNVTEIKVETITLQSFIESKKIFPGYIKIDVEGHELQVLQGLDYKAPILSFEWISELADKNSDCLKEAHRIGYTRFNLSTINEDILGPEDDWLELEDAINKFYEFEKEDSKMTLWGNAWCI